MKAFKKMISKGTAQNSIDKRREAEIRTVSEDGCKPGLCIWAVDCSGSMSLPATFVNESGEQVTMTKIDQVNKAFPQVIGATRDVEDKNPGLRLKINVIEINSYSKALYPEFQPVGNRFSEIHFEAYGATNYHAALESVKTLLTPANLKDGRKGREGKLINTPIYLFFMSDGEPTDVNGTPLTPAEYTAMVDEFKAYLINIGCARNVIISCIAVGSDANIDFLRYLAGDNAESGDSSHVYYIDDCESIGDMMVFATCDTFKLSTTMDIPFPIDEDEDNEDLDEDEDDEDLDEDEDDNLFNDYDDEDDDEDDEDSDLTLDKLCDGLD